MKAKVNITKELIRLGTRGSSTRCPVGLALAKAFPDFANLTTLEACFGFPPIKTPLHLGLTDWLYCYDKGLPVWPVKVGVYRGNQIWIINQALEREYTRNRDFLGKRRKKWLEKRILPTAKEF